MTIQSEVEVKQVRIVQGTGEQISKAKSSGEILDTDLVIQTDAPELQEKIDDLDSIRTNANLGAVASSELPAVRQTAETAESIARGKARSQVFDTKTAMETWLKSADHKGELSVGDNIYIKAKDTPDYWISEVLTTKDPTTQYWYKISELEAEKPDISNMVTTDTQQTISGNKNFTGTLQKSGVNVATTTNVSTAVSNHNNDANAHDGIKQDVSNLQAKVEQIELFKFPNAIIRGTPTIQNGQISDFSTVSYLQFPFLIDFQDNAFQVDFCFTTSTNVQTQQNIIDSNFGIALAIKDGKGLMAISSNGTGWNIGSAVGTIAIQPNTTYYARLLWNKLQYKTLLSTDGQTYTQDMVLTGATRPYPRTAFIGGCNQEETGHTPHPFLGTINMNKAYLYINNQLIWQGMDDAGLSTRADVSLNNLDAEGEARFTAKQDVISDLETIRTGAGLGATALQSISSSDVTGALGYTPALGSDLDSHVNNTVMHVTSSERNTWNNKQSALVSGSNIKTINGNSILGSGNLSVTASVTYDATNKRIKF